MTDKPSPDSPSGNTRTPPSANKTLVLLDVRHRVEASHLERWLRESGLAGAPEHFQLLRCSTERRNTKDISALQAMLDEPNLRVLPVRVAWLLPEFDQQRGLRKRDLLGDPRRPSALRAKLILWRDQRRGHCFAGKAATVAELRGLGGSAAASGDGLADFVLRQAGLALDIAERSLQGSRYKSPRFVADNIRNNPRYQAELSSIAGQEGKTAEQLQDEAGSYMDEMISRPRPLFIDMKASLERFLLSLGYGKEPLVATSEVERLRQTIKEKPTLLLFTHKTYLDGLAATDIAYRNDMPLIHTFGGINMAMPGLSTMMRGAGGIFIRRSFRDNKLYKLVLRQYIAYLMEKRFPLTWAFEGTRSRIGKLNPPRYGLLKYVIDAAHQNDIRDLHFLPVSTSFELIRDVDDYVDEQAGKSKKPESLSWFLGYVRSLRKPKGRIYVNFADPVIVVKAPDPDDKLALAKIAFEVAVGANRVTPLTLNSLLCLILLGSAPRGLTLKELHDSLEYFITWGKARGIRLSETLQRAESNPEEISEIADLLVNSGLFVRYDQASETVMTVAPDKHAAANYYRNTIIHHFIDRAIVELALLKAAETESGDAQSVFWSEAENLRNLFKFEFFWPEKSVFKTQISMELSQLNQQWAEKLKAGSSGVRELLSACQPLIAHSVFETFVEAYSVVIEQFIRLPDGHTLDQEHCVTQCLKEGRAALLLGRIQSDASIAKTMFENGHKLVCNLKLNESNSEQQRQKQKILLKEFRQLAHRLRLSRLENVKLADNYFHNLEQENV